MRESSAMDGSPPNTQASDVGSAGLEECHPWTLDSGFPAGMTVLFSCLTVSMASCGCPDRVWFPGLGAEIAPGDARGDIVFPALDDPA
jgi:hypothetical protein